MARSAECRENLTDLSYRANRTHRSRRRRRRLRTANAAADALLCDARGAADAPLTGTKEEVAIVRRRRENQWGGADGVLMVMVW